MQYMYSRKAVFYIERPQVSGDKSEILMKKAD